MIFGVTHDGQDHDDKVEDVPGLLEVVLPESKDLEDALGGEDDNEAHVEVVQRKAPHDGLLVVVQGHRQHVQEDEEHDDHVELLVGDDPKDDGLGFPLETGEPLCQAI